jgi:hypothetical protein
VFPAVTYGTFGTMTPLPKELPLRVRLDAEHAKTLATIARTDKQSKNDTILAGIDALAALRVRDEGFRERLCQNAASDRALLDKYSADA